MLQVVQEVRIRRLPRVSIPGQAGSCLLRKVVLLSSVLTLMLFLDDSGRDLNCDLIFLQLFPLSFPFVLCSTVWTDLPDGLKLYLHFLFHMRTSRLIVNIHLMLSWSVYKSPFYFLF